MRYEDTVNGRRIGVWTVEENSRWIWRYSIDSGPVVKSEGGPNAPQRLVLCKGIDQARRDVLRRAVT